MRTNSTIVILLGLALPAIVGCEASNSEEERGRRGPLRFLGQAFGQLKRLGELVNPDAVEEAKKTWDTLRLGARGVRAGRQRRSQPLVQALTINSPANPTKDRRGSVPARGVRLRGVILVEACFTHGVEASGLNSDVRGALDELRQALELPEFGEDEKLELKMKEKMEELARDGLEAAKGVFSDVLDHVSEEISGTFESLLSDTLSEENLREASATWRRFLDTPGIKLLVRNRILWAGAEEAMQRHLNSLMSERTAKLAERVVNATADFTLHFAGLPQNSEKSDFEVFQELSAKMCHLQVAAEKVLPVISGAMRLLGYESYVATAEKFVRAQAISRITLTVCATTLTGLEPGRDPFLLSVIVSFSLGHLTKDTALNMAAFFHKALLEASAPGEGVTGEGVADPGQNRAVDFVMELFKGESTCDYLGRQIFGFLEVVKRALPESLQGTPEGSTRSPRKLGMDGMVLRATLLAAAVLNDASVSTVALSILLILVVQVAWLRWCLRQFFPSAPARGPGRPED